MQPDRAQAVLRRVDRTVGDLRRGGLVAIADRRAGGVGGLVQAAELVTADGLEALRRAAIGPLALVLTGARARALGLCGGGSLVTMPLPGGIVTMPLPGGIDAQAVRVLADPTAAPAAWHGADMPADEVRPAVAAAAVELAKLAELLPAAVVAPLADGVYRDLAAWSAARDLLMVEAAAVADYRRLAALSLRRVSEVRVPLAGAESARVVAFRPEHGGIEQLAVVIGDPARVDAPLCRLHSACFTGDLLGSMRCDCGEQLRGAIRRMDEAGAGVLLYLAHEGRGIGLVNKLKAYQLQDRGLDTVDANQHLGFETDERTWLAAAVMLRQLGLERLRLLTNNPDKVEALARHGIEVVERIPHSFQANPHNRRYLQTKAARSGHHLALGEDPVGPLRRLGTG
jgi:GTP cyclohydrolase II